jgi:hypothetical protein
MVAFYRDYGDADVERLAKRMCEKLGTDPLSLIPDNGYTDAPLIPRWWTQQEYAARFIAAREFFASEAAPDADRDD